MHVAEIMRWLFLVLMDSLRIDINIIAIRLRKTIDGFEFGLYS